MAKKIPLSKNGKHKGKYFAIVDDKDFDWLNSYSWQVAITKRNIYAKRFCKHGGKYKSQYLHRFIAGNPRGFDIDHRDHNGLNCRRENLRKCSRSQNSHNRIKEKGRSSKYFGVSFNKRLRQWISYISFNNKKITIGCFKNEDAAAIAYNKVAIKYYGRFANLNKIERKKQIAKSA